MGINPREQAMLTVALKTAAFVWGGEPNCQSFKYIVFGGYSSRSRQPRGQKVCLQKKKSTTLSHNLRSQSM